MSSTGQFSLTAVVLHAFAASSMAYGWFGLQGLALSDWVEGQKGGHFQFLTIQGLAVAWLTMVMGLLLDLLPSFRVVAKAKRALLMIALPLAVVVSTVYWTLLLLLPHFIIRPEDSDTRDPLSREPSSSSDAPNLARIPFQLDLALHAVPAISLVVDFYWLERKYSKGIAKYGGALVAALAGLGYSLWVEECARFNGIFPYPFLTFNPLEIRIVIYTVLTIFAYVCFLAMNAFHS